MRHVLVALVDLYRKLLSPVLPPMCRFEPSCSRYARDALLTHGAFKGTALAAWRVLRCNPLTKGGTYDPVPGTTRPGAASGPRGGA
ncbi:MAG: membrane protein insertion efficiency factor YidD [Planctomycetota bacterium]